MLLHHVLTETAWAEALRTGRYAPPELARDGFLHCCTEAQRAFVLARHFQGAINLLVLTFESGETGASVQWVKSEPDQDPFPHLHGAIPVAAVRAATPPA